MDFGMRMPEFEIGIVVIEAPDQPGIGVVATCTILTEAEFVNIVAAMTINTFIALIAKNGRCMAGFTAEHGMLAYEREFTQIMVKSHRVLPGDLAVALFTLDALSFLVGIVLFMATVTGGIDFLGFGTNRMTGLAYQVLMRAVKCEIGVCVVVEFRIPPAFNDMAIPAFFTVLLIVNIVRPMTAVTIAWLFVSFAGNLVIVGVAVITALPAVFFFEFVAGVPVMLESRFVPGFFLVAACAVFAEPFGMYVSYCVAIEAALWCIFVCLIIMAGVTGYFLVPSFKFEIGLVMIKLGFAPSSGDMTVLALLA